MQAAACTQVAGGPGGGFHNWDFVSICSRGETWESKKDGHMNPIDLTSIRGN